MSAIYEFLVLIVEFFKTGLFAVGGGLATIPFLKQMAEKYDWFTVPELTDMIAVSESTPGPIGVNMATYAGFNMGFSGGDGTLMGVLLGVLGGIAATLALIAPSIIIILIVAKFLERFKTNKLVDGAFYGIRPCSAALIAAAMLDVLLLSIFSETLKTVNIGSIAISVPETVNYAGLILFAVMIPLVAKIKKVHPIVFIAIGAAAGIILKL